MSQVPTADISAFSSNDTSERRVAAAMTVADAIRQHGCLGITGHGLSQSVIHRAFEMAKKFFELSDEQKMKAPHPSTPTPHRGYLSPGIEKTGKLGALHATADEDKKQVAKQIDWKETYDIGSEDNQQQKNIWLPEAILPNFKATMVDFYDRMTGVADAMLEALMIGMELNQQEIETLRTIHKNSEHQMRLLHYLPLTPERRSDPDIVRLAMHRDFCSFTILVQEETAGLEFENRQTGEFMPADPRDGVLYVNIADFFERLSNGFYPSALHRVARPSLDEHETIPSRFSIPFFVNVEFEHVIEPLESRVKKDGEARFKPIKGSEWAQQLFELTQSKG